MHEAPSRRLRRMAAAEFRALRLESINFACPLPAAYAQTHLG